MTVSEPLSIDEKKWFVVIAKEKYVNLLLVNKLLNSIASYVSRLSTETLPSCKAIDKHSQKRKLQHLSDTGSLNKGIMVLGLKNC